MIAAHKHNVSIGATWDNNEVNKSEQLLALAKLRQSKIYEGYTGIGDYWDGVYECDHVSPYTKTAGNVDAEVMFILKDWSSDEQLSGPVGEHGRDSIEFGYDPSVRTNKNLRALLKVHFGLSLQDTFGTNLFPFIKKGAMNASIPMRDLTAAAVEFAIPQIEVVSPKVVICLGKDVINAIRKGIGMDRVDYLTQAIDSPFSHGEVRIWAQSHPSQQGTNNRNRIGSVSDDWSRMSEEARINLQI